MMCVQSMVGSERKWVTVKEKHRADVTRERFQVRLLKKYQYLIPKYSEYCKYEKYKSCIL